MSLEMYQQQILDHYKHPRNFSVLESATNHAHVANPLCGDELDMYLSVEGEKISAISFQGRGCTIAVASASMLTEFLKNKTLAEAHALTNDDVVKLLGVPVNPARLKCATLSLEAVQQALKKV
jgi:nitrogen fixation NifU-like protein